MIVARKESTNFTPVQGVAAGSLNDKGPLRLVLLVWLAMSVMALALVAIYGSNVPSWDDWDMVPTATGHQPITLQWLWSQHNEHRIPVPRLIYLAMMRLLPMDFRTGMYFNVLVTGGLALAMVLVMRRARGSSNYLDAFFPIALLNWSQAPNFVWCWQVEFYASTSLAGAVLILIALSPGPPKGVAGVAAGICVALLPLCGAHGLGMVPALALWLGYAGIEHWRSNTPARRHDAIIPIVFAVAALLLTGLYFLGFNKVPYHPSTHNPRVIAKTALQFLTMGFGPGVVGLSFEKRVPLPFWKLACSAIAGLLALTVWTLLTAWRKRPAERTRVAGLLCFLAAMVSLALGLGMGRNGFEIRYVTLSVPAICAICFVWSLYGAPRLRSTVQIILFATTVLVFVPNTWWGWRYADDLRSHLKAFEAEMIAGSPPYQLVHDYAGTYLHPHQLMVMDYLPFLRQAGVGAFRYLRDNPSFRELSLQLKPIESNDVTIQNGIPRANGMGGNLTFALPTEMNVAGIRIRYTYTTSLPYLAIYWKSQNQSDFRDDSHTKYSPTGDRANWGRITWARLQDDSSTVFAWVCGPVQMIRILPMSHATVDIRDVVLLVRKDVDSGP